MYLQSIIVIPQTLLVHALYKNSFENLWRSRPTSYTQRVKVTCIAQLVAAEILRVHTYVPTTVCFHEFIVKSSVACAGNDFGSLEEQEHHSVNNLLLGVNGILI